MKSSVFTTIITAYLMNDKNHFIVETVKFENLGTVRFDTRLYSPYGWDYSTRTDDTLAGGLTTFGTTVNRLMKEEGVKMVGPEEFNDTLETKGA